MGTVYQSTCGCLTSQSPDHTTYPNEDAYERDLEIWYRQWMDACDEHHSQCCKERQRLLKSGSILQVCLYGDPENCQHLTKYDLVQQSLGNVLRALELRLNLSNQRRDQINDRLKTQQLSEQESTQLLNDLSTIGGRVSGLTLAIRFINKEMEIAKNKIPVQEEAQE